MKTKHFLMVALSAAALVSGPALFSAPNPQEHHEAEAKRDHAEYHFRQEDAPKLRQHYKKIEHVDVAHRTALVAGARLPDNWHGRMHAVPAAVIRELPAPPPGYAFGYIDGYCVVYDPTTLLIADVIDLATLGH
jgi:Ni/Co efflux regulator RcnB